MIGLGLGKKSSGILSAAVLPTAIVAGLYIVLTIFAFAFPYFQVPFLVTELVSGIILFYFGYESAKTKDIGVKESVASGIIASIASFAIYLTVMLVFFAVFSLGETIYLFAIVLSILNIGGDPNTASFLFVVLFALFMATIYFSLKGALFSLLGAMLGKRL